MFEELVFGSPLFSLFVLLKDLFWTGLLFLLHRHLHQSGALTMEALQDPPPDPVEGMEEDIADKVGPGWAEGTEDHVWITRPQSQDLCWVPWPSAVGPPWDVLVTVHLGHQASSWQAGRAQWELVMVP